MRKRQGLDSWHVDPSANRDLDFLDGVRGVAILMVVACHLVYLNPQAGPVTRFLRGVLDGGGQGVTVFFALSGFLISWPFWKRIAKGAPHVVPTGYGWRRFWKIYPPLALTVVVLGALYFVTTRDPGYLGVAMQWLAGLPVALPITGKLNSVMWSLVVEVQFYCILPLVFLLVRRIRPRTAVWVLFGAFLVLPSALRYWGMARGAYFTVEPIVATHCLFWFDAFACGILVAGLESTGRLPKGLARYAWLGFVILAFAVTLTPWLEFKQVGSESLRGELRIWLVKLASGLLLCYVADPERAPARLLAAPCLRWCGLISYEWYLFHWPIILAARIGFGPANGNLLKYALIVGGSLCLSLALAAGVYRWFSMPLLRHGRSAHSAKPHPRPVMSPA